MHPMRFGHQQPDCGERKIRHTFACRAILQTDTIHSIKNCASQWTVLSGICRECAGSSVPSSSCVNQNRRKKCVAVSSNARLEYEPDRHV
jgi:hypothetical protein